MMLRAMTRGDIDAVLCIEQAVQHFPWTRGNFSDALCSGYLCYVDETEDDGIRGYAILMQAADEAELLTIGVAATQQRKGLGCAILSEILNIARTRQLRRVFLEVRPSNVAAIALYRNTGFNKIGVRRGYYRDANGSEDAITMACDLIQHASLPPAGERPGERANG